MTVYLSAVAWRRVEQARAAIDVHSRVTPFGRCTECGQVAPCAVREREHATLARYHQLPQRRRRPENVGAFEV
jgi:hypothetical protein